MTLNDLIVAALDRLDRGADAQTITAYRNKFAAYANKAVKLVARTFKQSLKETLELDVEKQFDVNALSRGCFKILEVRAGGKKADFWQEPPGSGFFTVPTKEDSVTVTYQFVPKTLSSTSDVPELPEHMHDMLVHYIVACERAGGDPETQGTASVDFQLFNDMLRNLVPERRGEPCSYQLKGYW